MSVTAVEQSITASATETVVSVQPCPFPGTRLRGVYIDMHETRTMPGDPPGCAVFLDPTEAEWLIATIRAVLDGNPA